MARCPDRPGACRRDGRPGGRARYRELVLTPTGLALLTGAASPLGRALVGALAARGSSLLLSAADGAKLRSLAAELGADSLAGDLAHEAARRELVAAAEDRGGLELLLNLAEAPDASGVLDFDPEAAREALERDALSALEITGGLLGALVEARGAVVNVVPVDPVGGRDESASAPARAALLAWSRALAPGARRQGVRVLTVQLGATAPALGANRLTRSFVGKPEVAATAILHALDGGRSELSIPAPLRVATLLASALPGTITRLGNKRR